jgi:hypothetical protein
MKLVVRENTGFSVDMVYSKLYSWSQQLRVDVRIRTGGK